MSDSTNIRLRFQSLEIAETFAAFSKVIVNVSDDVRYVSGTDTGRTLELTSQYGSQKVADDILARVQGHQYQPFTASGAILDPAAELGDGITADRIYGGIFSKKISLGHLYTADVSAPGGEKINYTAPYKSKQERTIERNYRNLSTELKIQAGLISAEVTERKSDVESLMSALRVQSGQIEAKVSSTGGNAASFGWELLLDSWTLKSKNSDVFRATEDGVKVSGEIIAKTGKIGGLDIKSDHLSFNNMTWGGTNTTGVYIGTRGIQLGKNFRVDNAGNLYAASGTFDGTVKAGRIEYGGNSGTLSGSALTAGSVRGGSGGAIRGSTLTTYNMTSGINNCFGYAEYANSIFNGIGRAPYIYVDYAHLSNFYIGRSPEYRVTPKSAVYKDGNGVNRTLYYLAWAQA